MVIARPYRLRCPACGARREDDGTALRCTNEHAPSLLKSEYTESTFRAGGAESVLRYSSWLPLGRDIATDARIGIYRSTEIGAALGLDQLWIAFCGWWPDRGATLRTATFKELEALTVLGRMSPDERRPLVVASAGNTGAAFADACTVNDMPVVIILPESAWSRVAAIVPHVSPTVKIVTLADASYDEAIAFSRTLAATDDFILEGGVQNVARRDGLGIVMLAAVEAIGTLPAAYIQAVGSAAGALGVSEAAQRLIGDGRYGSTLPRLLLAQNAPWSPIADAWRMRSETLLDHSHVDVQARLAALGAPVLSNQAPPYALAGGVREALAASGGSVYAVDNEAMSDAMMLFARCEGIDIDPEAGVAVAALTRAVAEGAVDPAAPILINITGGGRAARVRPSANARPALHLSRNAFESTGVDDVRALFSTTAR